MKGKVICAEIKKMNNMEIKYKRMKKMVIFYDHQGNRLFLFKKTCYNYSVKIAVRDVCFILNDFKITLYYSYV